MRKGKEIMKYLIVKNGRAFFKDVEENEKGIDCIGKDDILFLLRQVTNPDVNFEMDDLDNNIKNEAEKIIYENIYTKFQDLLKNKEKFIDESKSLYKVAFAKYKESK